MPTRQTFKTPTSIQDMKGLIVTGSLRLSEQQDHVARTILPVRISSPLVRSVPLPANAPCLHPPSSVSPTRWVLIGSANSGGFFARTYCRKERGVT